MNFIKHTLSFFSQKKQLEFHRLHSRLLAGDIQRKHPSMGFWVKNSNYELLDISTEAALILYGMTSDQCVGQTDYDIALRVGFTGDIKQFADVCRRSDNLLRDSFNPHIFYEIITDLTGSKRVWRTTKSRVKFGGDIYLVGVAEFLDMIYGLEGALQMVEGAMACQHITKINDNLYTYNLENPCPLLQN